MKKIFKELKRNWHYFEGYRFLFFITYFLKSIVIAATLINPLMFSRVITAIMSKDMRMMVIMLGVTVFFKLLSIGIAQISARIDIHIQKGVNYKAKQILFNQLMATPPSRLANLNDGKIYTLIISDSVNISAYVYSVIESLFNVFTVIAIGLIIFFISWPLALALLVTYPLTYLVNKHYSKKIKNQVTEIYKETDNFTSFYKTVITNLGELKIMNAHKQIARFFANKTMVMKKQGVENEKTQTRNNLFINLIDVLNYIVILIFGAFFVITDRLILGDFVAFTNYSTSFTSGLNSIVNMNAKLQPSLAILERIEEFERICNESKLEQAKKEYPENVHGRIRFENVSLSLGNKEILRDVNFEISPNTIYGIFGRNGSGKTTIFNMLTQLYSPSEGNIFLDGINIADLQYKFLQDNIAYVRQNPILFNMSLLDNILLFNESKDISLDDVLEACEKVNFLEDIQIMPQGLETEISDNRKLSVGQTQKVQLARILLMDKPIILIDEATVNLDQISRQKVYDMVKDFAQTKTIVFITNNENESVLCDDAFIIT